MRSRLSPRLGQPRTLATFTVVLGPKLGILFTATRAITGSESQ